MPVSTTRLIDIINKNKNKKVAVNRIIEANPKVLPVLPKLIRDNSKISNIEKDHVNINKAILESVYNKIKSIKKNNENIIKLFPDIELAIQILISSILSPKKMTDYELIYKFHKDLNLDPNISSELLNTIKEYINDNYELENILPDILREALFTSGAYVYVVVPESSVDEVINSDLSINYSAESFTGKIDAIIQQINKPINILKVEDTEYALEKIGVKVDDFVNYIASSSFVNITDNVNLVKFPKVKDKITKQILKSNLRKNVTIAQEAFDKIQYIDIFRPRQATLTNKDIEFIKTKYETRRKSLGKPMVMKLPTEAIIPVFTPGNPKDHVGYFVLLDELGKPIELSLTENNLDSFYINQNNPAVQLTPVQKAYNNLITDTSKNIDVNTLFNMYKEVIEKRLYNTIKNSLYGTNVEIADQNDIFFLMFTRALANQKTSVLFIPCELVTYFAFYYNSYGVGKTLLENISILTSLRAILLFSKVMALAKQSIDVTRVNITLDPNDPDPEKTIEQIQDSVLKLRQNFFPLGINNPLDLVNWIQRAGLQFSYENNPLIPEVKIDFENANLSHTVPDSDLEEELRKQTIIALGLPPETVDNGFNPEFATTVVNNNVLLSKRVLIYQKTLLAHLYKLINIIIENDEELRKKIKEIIVENSDKLLETLEENEKALYNKDKDEFIEYMIDTIANHIEVSLPKPENTNLENLSAEFDLYRENLEKVIDSVISEEIFSSEIAGELNTSIESIKNIIKHYLLRKWMSENNFYPEVLEFSSNEEEVENILKVISMHLSYTMRNSDKLLAMMKKFRLASDKDLANIKDDDATVNTSTTENTKKESEELDSDFGDLF